MSKIRAGVIRYKEYNNQNGVCQWIKFHWTNFQWIQLLDEFSIGPVLLNQFSGNEPQRPGRHGAFFMKVVKCTYCISETRALLSKQS